MNARLPSEEYTLPEDAGPNADGHLCEICFHEGTIPLDQLFANCIMLLEVNFSKSKGTKETVLKARFSVDSGTGLEGKRRGFSSNISFFQSFPSPLGQSFTRSHNHRHHQLHLTDNLAPCSFPIPLYSFQQKEHRAIFDSSIKHSSLEIKPTSFKRRKKRYSDHQR